MDNHHPLKTLLQLHVASDGSAVLHLPYILSSLTSQALEPSSHLQKWKTRINSLIYSKDGGARWAGLCIALRTSVLSREIMLECAQSWVTASLSLVAVGTLPCHISTTSNPMIQTFRRRTKACLCLRHASACFAIYSRPQLVSPNFNVK